MESCKACGPERDICKDRVEEPRKQLKISVKKITGMKTIGK